MPSDSLDSIFIAREVSGRAAVVSRQRWTFPNGTLRGTHVLTEPAAGMEIRDGKKREAKLERGAVLSLLDLQDGKAPPVIRQHRQHHAAARPARADHRRP